MSCDKVGSSLQWLVRLDKLSVAIIDKNNAVGILFLDDPHRFTDLSNIEWRPPAELLERCSATILVDLLGSSLNRCEVHGTIIVERELLIPNSTGYEAAS